MRNMKVHRRVGAAIAAVVGLGMLVACGDSDSPKGNSDALDVSSAQSLYTAAKKEDGDVLWYTTMNEEIYPKVIDAFEKAYPGVTVKALGLSGPDILARVTTEYAAKTYAVDVVSGEDTYIDQLRQEGNAAKFVPPSLKPDDEMATVLKATGLPEGFQNILYVVESVLAYNPTAVADLGLPTPTDWADFTDPKWKGHFSAGPDSVVWYVSLIQSMGHDAALDLMKALGKNEPVLVDSHTTAVNDVVGGEPAGTINAYAYSGYALQTDNPDNMKIVHTNPQPANLALVYPVTKAPHPAGADLFVDWLVSKEGQQVIASETGQISVRSDVENNPEVWDPTTWTPEFADTTLTGDELNEYLDEYETAIGAK
jgi:iron(III) transport system substrate-binding protein